MAKAKEKYKRIIKECQTCKNEFKVFPFRKNAKYCSNKCNRNLHRKDAKITEEHKQKLQEGRKKFIYTPEIRGKMSYIKKEQFKNGIKPWNKNRKGVYSEETRKKMGASNGFGKEAHNWKGGLNPMWIRKQRLKVNGGSHTLSEWENLKVQYNFTCPCCKKQKQLTKDHIIPVTKGGSDNIENIQPLCQNCNSKKHKKRHYYKKK